MTLRELIDKTLLEYFNLTQEDQDVDAATVEELQGRNITDIGREEWADVLDARVVAIYDNNVDGTIIELANVEPSRIKHFCNYFKFEV